MEDIIKKLLDLGFTVSYLQTFTPADDVPNYQFRDVKCSSNAIKNLKIYPNKALSKKEIKKLYKKYK